MQGFRFFFLKKGQCHIWRTKKSVFKVWSLRYLSCNGHHIETSHYTCFGYLITELIEFELYKTQQITSITLSPPAINNMCKLHLITSHLGHLQMELCAYHINTLHSGKAIMYYLWKEGTMITARAFLFLLLRLFAV